MRQKCPDAVNHAHQVDIEYPAPALERNVLNPAACGNTGIIAKDVDFSECIECRLRRTRDACPIRNVAIDAAHVRSDIVKALHCSI